MAITKKSGRQEVISAQIDLTFDTLSSDAAVAEAVIEVPAGAVVIGGFISVNTAFDSTTSDVLDICDSIDDDRYSATPIDLQTLGVTALDIAGYEYQTVNNIAVEWTAGSTGTATAGSATLYVQYVERNRAAFSQG